MEEKVEESIATVSSCKKRKLDPGTLSNLSKEGHDETTCPEYLHDFFPCPETPYDGGKTAVIYDDGKGISERITYVELDNAANSLKELLERKPFVNSGFIGVTCDLGILYPAIIIGILRSGKAFFNIDQENWEEAVVVGGSHLNMKYFVCEPSWEPAPLYEAFSLRKVTNIAGNADGFNFSVYETSLKSPLAPLKINGSLTTPRFAYAIQTSGTTGKKKTVLVPHVCICPNIYDFIHVRWKLTSEDVIFGCAASTFDPHIVELFSILAVGGTIIYTSSDVKQASHLLISILATHRVSILQITPSLFRKMYAAFTNRIEHLSLRIVAFGGEKCPSKAELKKLRDALSPLSDILFQNIYGITEVSCWASVCNIDLTSDAPISLGEGILDTGIFLEGTTGEIILTSSTRHCVIIDAMQNVILDPAIDTRRSPDSTKLRFEYCTGDLGRLQGESIIFEGRMDRVVKRNGMKIPLFKIEEMALATGLVSYAECVLYRSKILMLVQLKPEFRQAKRNSQANSSNILLPSLSKTLDIPLFMYPDFIVDLNVIPLSMNGKLDCKNVIDFLIKVKEGRSSENIPFDISKDQVVKTLDQIWRSCTYPGRRSIHLMLRENFIEVGGTSLSTARFIESAFLSLKLFGSDTHDRYEQAIKEMLFQGTFNSVVELICEIISRQNCLNTNFSSFTNDLNEIQKQLFPPKYSIMKDQFESEMDEEAIFNDDCSVFNEVDADPDLNSKIKIASPIQFVNMYDFPLALCVDASPTIVKGKGNTRDRAIIGCHGGILLCIDLSVLRNYSKSSNLAIAWKRRLPGRLEAAVVSDGSGLYGYVGCHDRNFYKFSVSTGETICFTSFSAPIRSKAAVNNEFEVVIVVDSDNCIYCLNYHDLNLIWQKRYRLLATINPVSWRNMCYLSTLENGLIALDLHTGSEIWSSSDMSYYSSPTLVYNNDKGENCTKPRKKKYLVLTGSLNSANDEVVEARNAKTGRLEWTYFVPSANPLQTVSQPVYNTCCDNIAWISLSDFCLTSLSSANGNLNYKLCCNFTHPHEVNRCCLISCMSKDEIRMNECVVFCKMNDMNKFMFVNVHNKQFLLIKPWFMIKGFDTFSVPVNTNEFILFGGRDNKLHVIECKLVNKNTT